MLREQSRNDRVDDCIFRQRSMDHRRSAVDRQRKLETRVQKLDMIIGSTLLSWNDGLVTITMFSTHVTGKVAEGRRSSIHKNVGVVITRTTSENLPISTECLVGLYTELLQLLEKTILTGGKASPGHR